MSQDPDAAALAQALAYEPGLTVEALKAVTDKLMANAVAPKDCYLIVCDESVKALAEALGFAPSKMVPVSAYFVENPPIIMPVQR